MEKMSKGKRVHGAEIGPVREYLPILLGSSPEK
jgi:hypothetical protein